MKNILYESERTFNICDYKLSLRRLLLRSSNWNSYEKNIDVIFFGVFYINLIDMCDGIKISLSEGGKCEYKAVENKLNFDVNRMFVVETGGECFYIGASFFKVIENRDNPWEDLKFDAEKNGDVIYQYSPQPEP